uniref:baseplate J/gp47 family protein n=1 Tax=uncultured Allisonella sp. TaxID=339338 RepID=UPI0025959279|nr:baseplate J/gp47 family protein [uncultured Allisonella sp.]
MFENQTEQVIEKRMLDSMPKSIDKREGSIAYDATMPAAIEFMLLYSVVDYFLKNTFGDTADREYLIERAKERGLKPYEATNAIAAIQSTPADCVLPVGSRYSVDDVNYIIIGQLDGANQFKARCETPGTKGNKASGKAVPITYVPGLQHADIVSVIQPGEDEEETEAFRERYLKSFETQAYGGNIADYQKKVGEIQGVGGVKVYPVWNGGGTVKVVFSTSENKVPEDEFVKEVQELIDPVPYAQNGVGIAPIGHRVTVEGAGTSAINIGLNIKFGEGGNFANYKADMTEVIRDYFDELNASWQDTEVVSVTKYENRGIIVRISQIESRLLQKSYVADISHTTLNGAEENIELRSNELATVGTVADISGGA